ncbi:10160_t:CDS:10 [Funneliformis geosporum]|uniref:protein-serine/threonine phosphatase n=1 Tax=Funneliformis geosporum TaxID=1117311 RepID=A0A9W4WQU6_9GLOM|nr:10160_t:CDS:10 [Funneliformis geosporum]
MGQTLSEPVKEKHSDRGSDKRIVYASSAMQGWRISMEDAHTAELTLKDKNGYSFFGVYDGHGGQNVAKYSGAHLHERIARDPQFSSNLEDAIKNGFLGTDEDLKNDPQYANDPSGCTAVTAVVTPDDWIFVGNAGDSRAVMSKDGDALPMSIDHKPLNKEESSRIQKAGGFVEFGRVNGNLALSRAIGDFEFKQNPNLSPEEQIVTELIIREKTEFLVLACDGIWDCLSSQQVVNFIRRDIAQSKSLQTACENLMERCLAKDSELGGIGCDNMTVIIVGFLNGKNENDWYDWMASRYGNVGPIPSEQADEYLPDDNDLENQNELTIDDIPHRRESTDSDISSRSNSTDSVSKISPTEEAVNSVSSDGKETGKNPYNSKTWPGSKK